jgi:hypothetical protein|eukprot:COSAG01_NODE_3056_length_6658_cov_3.019210_6_plen_87_part_00
MKGEERTVIDRSVLSNSVIPKDDCAFGPLESAAELRLFHVFICAHHGPYQRYGLGNGSTSSIHRHTHIAETTARRSPLDPFQRYGS